MFPLHDGIVLSNTIEKNMRQEYTFTLKYLEAHVDQSDDMNKQLSGESI